jgi:hypothetical protein
MSPYAMLELANKNVKHHRAQGERIKIKKSRKSADFAD